MALHVGWCLCLSEARIAYESPQRFTPPKDPSKNARGFLSCPAVRQYFDGVFYVAAPFSLQLRCVRDGDRVSVKPVYPFTSIADEKFRELVVLEPPETWRDVHTVTLQVPSPYLFFTDVPATVEQFQPSLAATTAMNWRVIPGKFDIYAWQRPLNWAIEWDTNLGDLRIRAGEPLYFLKFQAIGQVDANIELIECELTPTLLERLQLSRGITGIRRGLTPLMRKAGQKRLNISLLKPNE